ncbi:MAG: Maf family protein [Planctomycetota bacterium]|jgi:septum formation protein
MGAESKSDPEGVVTVVLASASPRRSALLSQSGVDFVVRPTAADETLAAPVAPEDAARSLAERKARAGAEAWSEGAALVIGADTIVALPEGEAWTLLGKPTDARDAERMLRALSGSVHKVVTGVCVVAAPENHVCVDVETTEVHMRTLTDAEVADYVASGEWEDKAGGYAIQETADRFVTRLEGGGFDNVVGLPVARCRALLERCAQGVGRSWA